MVDVQTIGVVVTAASVTVAAIYYMFTLRTNQRNLKINLETRQAQFMNQISDGLTSLESTRSLLETQSIFWTDWEDFEKKYGSTGDNPESAVMRFSVFSKFENVGWLLEKGLLDPEWAYSQFHFWATPLWVKFEPWVMQMRKKWNSPTIFIGFEYLGRKFLEIEEHKGIKPIFVTTKESLKIGDS